MKFKGWDYSELAKAWRISTKDNEKMVEEMKEVIGKVSYMDNKEMRKTKVYRDCRAFLKALIKDTSKGRHTDYVNYWKGMQKARDPGNFLQFVIRNLERMWN